MYNPFKKREQKPTPPWVMWLLIAAVVFAFLSNHTRPGGEKPPFERTSRYLHREKNNFEGLKQRLLPEPDGPKISDIAEGSGAPATCGQRVRIAYSATLEEEVLENADGKSPLSFTLGDNITMPALQIGALGMKPGGKRELRLRWNVSDGLARYGREAKNPDSELLLSIELLSAEPPLPPASAFRIFNGPIGNGPRAECGDTVNAHLTLWSLDGKELFSTHAENGKPFSFTLGASQAFAGLEQGVIGMSVGSSRTLIVPPAWQKTISGAAQTSPLPLPKNQTVIVDVEILPQKTVE